MTDLLLLVMALNIFAFGVYAYDKIAARSGRRRVPEKTLLTMAAIGGAAGGLCAMYLMRHKTRHRIFTVGLPVMVVVHALAFLYLLPP